MHRILLVDDEPRNLALLEAILAPLGHELIRAVNGHEALERSADGSIDLVLVDGKMPGMSGIEVVTALRAREANTHVPVILVTEASDRDDRIQGLHAGADDYVERPIDGDVLLARVRTLVSLKAARDGVEARNAALEQLHRGQRELNEMLVHDLKSPLAVLRLTLSSLAEGQIVDPLEVREMAQDGDMAATRLQGMVEQLLLVARLERADLPLRPVSIRVPELLEDVAGLHRRSAASRHITLSVHAAPGVRVSADPDLLSRVFDNLVSNALRHTPMGGRVDLSARPGSGVEIAVSNTGLPIPDADRNRVFDKFWTGGARGRSGVNVGMGLYFCRRAIEAHGGRIQVGDLPEWPTTIVVSIPE